MPAKKATTRKNATPKVNPLEARLARVEKVISILVAPLDDAANESTQAGVEHLRARIRAARDVIAL